MYEFHSWVVIRNQQIDRENESNLISDTELHRKYENMIKALVAKLNERPGGILEDSYKLVGSNGSTTLHFSGLWNHAGPNVIDILEWIRINAPYSYGLAYIHDDECSEHPDDFVVYRLAKNKITKLEDHYLSPYFDEVDSGYYAD
ncbi:MAG: hypothetical protein IPM77_09730 [Crocinitomicaceae bacterium]|nr:hypothetical protein [Crocinitomicaceae bacterium]